MELSLVVQGMIVGLTLAAPVGPISLVCIYRTIAYGRFHGIFSGFGVASADSFYAAVAFLGLTAISGFIIAHQFLFRFVAGIALVLVGIRVFRSIPLAPAESDGQESYLRDYLSLLALTIANPLTIIFYLTILPGLGIVSMAAVPAAALDFVAGVFAGSALWWILLCGAVGSVRSRLSPANLVLINRISGALVACCGLGVLILVLALV